MEYIDGSPYTIVLTKKTGGEPCGKKLTWTMEEDYNKLLCLIIFPIKL